MKPPKPYAYEVRAIFNTKDDTSARISKTFCYRRVSEREARIKALCRNHCLQIESITPMTQAETARAYGIVQRM